MPHGSVALLGAFDLHHHRMIARWRNIMDTVVCRHPPIGTVAAEIAFLTEEVAVFRAFVDRHADAPEPVADRRPWAALQAEAAALDADMQALGALVGCWGEGDAAVVIRLARLGERFLAASQHAQLVVHHAVAERLDAWRAWLHTVPQPGPSAGNG